MNLTLEPSNFTILISTQGFWEDAIKTRFIQEFYYEMAMTTPLY